MIPVCPTSFLIIGTMGTANQWPIGSGEAKQMNESATYNLALGHPLEFREPLLGIPAVIGVVLGHRPILTFGVKWFSSVEEATCTSAANKSLCTTTTRTYWSIRQCNGSHSERATAKDVSRKKHTAMNRTRRPMRHSLWPPTHGHSGQDSLARRTK